MIIIGIIMMFTAFSIPCNNFLSGLGAAILAVLGVIKIVVGRIMILF